jgi:hypothetical protein
MQPFSLPTLPSQATQAPVDKTLYIFDRAYILIATLSVAIMLSSGMPARSQEMGPPGPPPIANDDGRNPPPESGGAQDTSPLGQALAEVSALRQLNELQLSPQELDAAVSTVRSMVTAQQTLEAASLKALDAERDGLLKQGPNDPAPVNSAFAMDDALNTFRDTQNTLWDKLATSIGDSKADALRRLMRPQRTPGQGRPGEDDPRNGGPLNGGPPFQGQPGADGQQPQQGDNRPNGPIAPIPARLSLAQWLTLLQEKRAAMGVAK